MCSAAGYEEDTWYITPSKCYEVGKAINDAPKGGVLTAAAIASMGIAVAEGRLHSLDAYDKGRILLGHLQDRRRRRRIQDMVQKREPHPLENDEPLCLEP